MKPLEGILVLDFSQFLSAPYAAMQLADMGAQVVKIENPAGGDLYRKLSIANCVVDGDQPLFHAANRGKESVALDLKNPDNRPAIETLIRKADVMIINFRPSAAKRLRLDYASVKALNPAIVYGTVSGYGPDGPWAERAGQDLLVQSASGLAYLNGNADQPPIAMGVGLTDIMAGEHLVQGVLSCLVRRGVTGEGGLVEVSLLESALDIQFEGFTAFLNDGELPVRSSINNANAYVNAPYGIYSTADGYLALAMTPIPKLGELLGCEALLAYQDSHTWATKRDEIKAILVEHLKTNTTAHWLGCLEPADIWCSDVMDWEKLMKSEGFQALDMLQDTVRGSGEVVHQLRFPVRIDGAPYKSSKAAPRLGEHNEAFLRSLLQEEKQ